ncbi:MAG: hypothetical protein ABJF10_19295 [Chthoniobacter sp.]|uniref:hypothetical protein n=1 Tax=Chthoniobacter sp. TaxID=2510640 RepID=UPI0032ADEA2D
MNPFSLRLSVYGTAALTTLMAVAEDPAPAGGNITDLKQALAEVPHNVANALRNAAARDTAATQASDLLRTKVQGRTAMLTFKIDVVEKETRGSETGYRVRAEEKHISEVGTNFITSLWVHFAMSENARVGALKKGGEISVTGKIAEAMVSAKPAPALHIVLSEAKVN